MREANVSLCWIKMSEFELIYQIDVTLKRINTLCAPDGFGKLCKKCQKYRWETT